MHKLMRIAVLLGIMTAVQPAQAVTITVVAAGGGPYDILSSDAFVGDVTAAGGAGTYTVDFFSSRLAKATANTSVTVIVGTVAFSGLTMEWIDTGTLGVLSSIPVVPSLTTLHSTFGGALPLAQSLRFSWTGSLAGASFDFDVVAAPVPLPGAAALLLSGLGVVALVRRRRATETV